MAVRISIFRVVSILALVLCIKSGFAESNEMTIFQFGPRNNPDKPIGLYHLTFSERGLIQKIEFYTNNGNSDNPYNWESVKLQRTRYLEVVDTNGEVKATYFKNTNSKGEIIKWFRKSNQENIWNEISTDGSKVIAELRINPVTGEYVYFDDGEQLGYLKKSVGKEEFFKYFDKAKGFFFDSIYILNENKSEIEIQNSAVRFHPQLKSYKDDFTVKYNFDGKERYTIIRTESDYPADFIDKLDLITTLDTQKISTENSVLNSLLVFSSPLPYYTYLHPFVTKRYQ